VRVVWWQAKHACFKGCAALSRYTFIKPGFAGGC
jgi:hypothetical protein